MEHKAFLFDFSAFERELRPLLEKALDTSALNELHRFIDQNFASLADPNEGEPLDRGWRAVMEEADPHQYGDLALTKYYNPRDDRGLGLGWEEAQRTLLAEIGSDAPLLGSTIGPPGNPFDPGKMGSYFQSPVQVASNLEMLRRHLVSRPSGPELLRKLAAVLEAAAGKGLYITF